MVDIAASIGIKASLDTAGVERGKVKISSLFDAIVRKGKATNVFFERASKLLTGLIKLGTTFGIATIGSITGLIAASPQFKVFLASLKEPFMRLSRFFGETFSPLLDTISQKFGEFVDVVTQNEEVKNFFDKWVKNISTFVESISKDDMKNFLTSAAELADKTISFAVDIAGDVKDLLFGTKEGGGLIGFILDTSDKITKTLGLKADTQTLALLGTAAVIFGPGPLTKGAGLILLGAAGISALEDIKQRDPTLGGAIEQNIAFAGMVVTDPMSAVRIYAREIANALRDITLSASFILEGTVGTSIGSEGLKSVSQTLDVT